MSVRDYVERFLGVLSIHGKTQRLKFGGKKEVSSYLDLECWEELDKIFLDYSADQERTFKEYLKYIVSEIHAPHIRYEGMLNSYLQCTKSICKSICSEISEK